MYAVIGEDKSDSDMIAVLMRRLAGATSLKIKTFGHDGCARLRRDGARQIGLFLDLGYTKFVVCHDADHNDPQSVRDRVMREIVRPAGVAGSCCILIPVQEIEAWILADIDAVTKVFSSWRPRPTKRDPERVNDPKELLERLCRRSSPRLIYEHSVHNAAVAKHLNIEKVQRRCPSFQPLVDFILNK